jgi:serine/threonine-protein kinase
MAERVREPVPPCAALQWVREVTRALERVHARGFVHWDPKPGNVLLSANGTRVVLTDFGLALPIDGPAREFVAGTAAYMSPEQWEPTGAHGVGPLSDVFVLGGALFHALTGQRPVEGHTMHEFAEAVRTSEPRRPSEARPDLGTGFDELCLRALQRTPADRYQSAAAFGAALDAHLARLADEHAG